MFTPEYAQFTIRYSTTRKYMGFGSTAFDVAIIIVCVLLRYNIEMASEVRVALPRGFMYSRCFRPFNMYTLT